MTHVWYHGNVIEEHCPISSSPSLNFYTSLNVRGLLGQREEVYMDEIT